MKGFYSLWTAPYFADRERDEFALQDFDLLTLLLSAAVYERYNGPSAMYADEAAGEYLKKRGLGDYFSRGILKMEVPSGIDPKIFWAAGKLAALKAEEQPSVMIDTDLIIWEPLEARLKNVRAAVIHREELNPEIYPRPESFGLREEYHFPPSWDFSVLPANTAMLFLRDPDFKEYYVEEAFRFMRSCLPTQDNLCPMVFAEQRILPMCACARNVYIKAFCDRIEQLREQKTFTHIWGHKNVFKYNMDERRAFCRRIMARLRSEYPSRYRYTAGIEELKEYIIA